MEPGAVPPGREERLRALLQVGRALVSDLDLEVVLERVLVAARELTGARYAALGVLDERREALEQFLTSGIDDETRKAIGPLPRGRGVLGVLIRDPRPLRLVDVGLHPHSYGLPPEHPPMHGFLGAPIRVRDAVYGNLYLTEKGSGDFDADDEEALVVLAEWAAIAIENARAYSSLQGNRDQLERAVAQFEATSEIAEALAGETDLGHVLELVAKRARALTDARATIVLLQAGTELVVEAIAGELDRALLGARIPIDGSVSGQVFRSGEPDRLADAPNRLHFTLAEQTQAQTGLFVPLRLRGRVLGVLSVFDRLREGPQFSERDEQLLSGFAASAAAAVATAQDTQIKELERSILATEQERARWARELHDDTLQELAALKLMLAQIGISADETARERQLQEAGERISQTVRGLRDLITDLRPAALDEFGLGAALEALTERVARRAELDIDLHVDLAYEAGREPNRLSPVLEDALYRIVQEALTNITKHSSANHAEVLVIERGQLVEVAVSDNGDGFDPESEFAGFGLLGMRERVTLGDGTMTIESTHGEGTTIRVSLPARRPNSDVTQVSA